MVQNKWVSLARHPVGVPVPGQDLTLETSQIDLSNPPPEGGLILKTNYVSFDPYLRGKMRANVKSYTASYQLNKPIYNNAISTVVASSTPRFKEGDVVVGKSNFAEYVVVGPETAAKELFEDGLSILENPLGLDPSIFLGALGMSGLTAYSSFYEIGKPVKGETIYISAASGAVGQIVGQLAKREGLVVIGSVGSDEKLKFITESLGFTAGFNHRKESPAKGLERVLGELGKEGIDIYYDNVGGETLDAALAASNNFGRIVVCGGISQTSLEPDQRHGITNTWFIISRRLTLRGFIVDDKDMGPAYAAEHQRNLQRWIKDGEIIIKQSVTEGIDNAAEGLVGVLKGENFGKAVLKIADL